MSLDFCSQCGRWIGSLEAVIRQGVDNQPEVVCSSCLKVEQKRTASLTVDMSIAKLISTGFIAL